MEEKMKSTTLCGWVLLGCSQGVVSLRSYAGVNKPAGRPVLQRLWSCTRTRHWEVAVTAPSLLLILSVLHTTLSEAPSSGFTVHS